MAFFRILNICFSTYSDSFNSRKMRWCVSKILCDFKGFLVYFLLLDSDRISVDLWRNKMVPCIRLVRIATPLQGSNLIYYLEFSRFIFMIWGRLHLSTHYCRSPIYFLRTHPVWWYLCVVKVLSSGIFHLLGSTHKFSRRISALWQLLYECLATVHNRIKYFGNDVLFHTSFSTGSILTPLMVIYSSFF